VKFLSDFSKKSRTFRPKIPMFKVQMLKLKVHSLKSYFVIQKFNNKHIYM